MLRAASSWRRRFAWRVLSRVAFAAALLVGACGWLLARGSGRPHPPFAEIPPPGCTALRLRAADGVELGAWHFPGPPAAPTVVVLPGWGGTRTSYLGAADFWRTRGCGALLLSLRGHGDSDGARHDLGYRAAADVLAAVAWLEQRRPGQPILLHGNSMGAAAAIFAAEALGPRVAGYLLESPYRDLRTALRNRVAAHVPTGAQTLVHGATLAAAWWVVPDLDRIAPVRAIRAAPASAPMLILAGAEDAYARTHEAEALRAAAPHARLVVVAGAGHEPLNAVDPRGYDAAVGAWLAECRAPRSP